MEIAVDAERGGLRKSDPVAGQKIGVHLGAVAGRKPFSDISNTVNVAAAFSTEDRVSKLLKENNALLRLLADRNKIIENSNDELQKLQIMLQKLNQQNWQLAQANSHMLVELNSGKDRVKAMQHELGCVAALLKAKTLELEENNKLIKQMSEIAKPELKVESAKADEAVANASKPASPKKSFNANRKRTLRNHSLGSLTVSNQIPLKEKDDRRRKSLRRRSTNLTAEQSVNNDVLFEIEDVKLPIRSSGSSDPIQDNTISSNSNPMRIVKNEVQKESVASPQSQQPVSRRSSIGRPMRKAAEKVSSYKEIPINLKMRRNE